MDLGIVTMLLVDAGMEIRGEGEGVVEARAKVFGVGIDTTLEVAVMRNGSVCVQRHRRMDGARRTERLLGCAVEVSGQSVEELMWRAQLDRPEQVLRLVELARDGRGDTEPGERIAGVRRGLRAAGFPAQAWSGTGR